MTLKCVTDSLTDWLSDHDLLFLELLLQLTTEHYLPRPARGVQFSPPCTRQCGLGRHNLLPGVGRPPRHCQLVQVTSIHFNPSQSILSYIHIFRGSQHRHLLDTQDTPAEMVSQSLGEFRVYPHIKQKLQVFFSCNQFISEFVNFKILLQWGVWKLWPFITHKNEQSTNSWPFLLSHKTLWPPVTL